MMPYQTYNFSTIPSTQEEAARIAKQLPSGTIAVVSAESQERGKGRENRGWDSPKGNLYLTFILPLLKQANGSTLSLVLAATVAKLLKHKGIRVQVKWPNDLLIDGAKVGGILGSGSSPLLLGIGLNVASHPILDRPTTCLNACALTSFDLEQLKTELIDSFLNNYKKWLEDGFEPFFPLWNSFLLHRKGDQIKVGQKKAIFLRADPSGAIWVEIDGNSKLIHSGEIEA